MWISIDAERTVETDTDRLRNDLLDLVESVPYSHLTLPAKA